MTMRQRSNEELKLTGPSAATVRGPRSDRDPHHCGEPVRLAA
jgi:hypothetical protein